MTEQGAPPAAGESEHAAGAAAAAGGARGGRLLVAATFGLPSSSANGALARTVAALSSAGEPLEVVSSDPRAVAHRYAHLHGLRGALTLARLSMRFERVIVAVGSGAVVGWGDRGIRRDLSLLACATALRRFGHATIWLDRLSDVPGGAGDPAARRLWEAADSIVVTSETDRKAFEALAGISAGRLRVEASCPSGARDANAAEGPTIDPVALPSAAETVGGRLVAELRKHTRLAGAVRRLLVRHSTCSRLTSGP